MPKSSHPPPDSKPLRLREDPTRPILQAWLAPEEMVQCPPGMAKEKARPRIAHGSADAFPVGGIKTMNGTSAAGWLARQVGTPGNPARRVFEQFRTIRAEPNRRAMPPSTVQLQKEP
jgi:hypothetical protein